MVNSYRHNRGSVAENPQRSRCAYLWQTEHGDRYMRPPSRFSLGSRNVLGDHLQFRPPAGMPGVFPPDEVEMAQSAQVTSNLRLRRSFGKIKKIIDIPNLIEIQKRSYDEFLQADLRPEEREDEGLQGVFKSVFPIKDFNETASLEFVSYELGIPKYDVEECHQRGMTYAAPLKVKIQLVIWDVENGRRSIKNVKEQEVYFGEIPLMTANGTFMVNGTERVIVSQLHRSPGVFFEHDKGRTHSTGKLLYSARIISYRGSWIDFEFDPRDVLYVRRLTGAASSPRPYPCGLSA